jgi:hypothetical protein
MARRNAAGYLTRRDLHILHWVGLGGLASLDQLARRFWPSMQASAALDRLRQLVKGGYLAMHRCDEWTAGERVFCLTKRGAQQFEPWVREQLYCGLPPAGEIKQQLLAQEAYLRLEAQVHIEGGRIVEWLPERRLRASLMSARYRAKQSGARLSQVSIPDAQVEIVSAKGERQLFYVEIDGAYYGRMLRQKAYALQESGHRVVWVCTKGRAGYIGRAVAPYRNIEVLCVSPPASTRWCRCRGRRQAQAQLLPLPRAWNRR